jgi:hypothetical protein
VAPSQTYSASRPAIPWAARLAVAATGAAVGWFAGRLLDPMANTWLLGVTTALFALANFAVPRVQTVFDQVLTDIQSLDEERIQRFERHVQEHRRRMLVVYVLAVLVALLPAGAAAVIAGVSSLKDPETPADWRTVQGLCAMGYAGFFTLVPLMWRQIRLVLQVNDFRQEVLDVVRREKLRAAALAASGRTPAIKQASPQPPMQAVRA